MLEPALNVEDGGQDAIIEPLAARRRMDGVRNPQCLRPREPRVRSAHKLGQSVTRADRPARTIALDAEPAEPGLRIPGLGHRGMPDERRLEPPSRAAPVAAHNRYRPEPDSRRRRLRG